MGDERNIPKPDTSYMGVPHEQLKSWTDEGEPGDANDLGDSWQKLGTGLTEAAENLMVAVFGSESGWTGAAANAMRAQLTKVAEWSQKTGDSFHKASQAFVKQGESVGAAKTAMPEPVDYDPGQMIKDAATSGNPLKLAFLPFQMHKQAEASKEAHAQAAEVVAKRDAELALAAQSIPPFEAPPALNGDGGKKPGPDGPEVPGGSHVPGGSSVNGPGNVPGAGHIGGPGGPGAPGGAGGPNAGAGVNGPNGDDQNQTPPSISVPSLPLGSGTGTSGYSPTPPPNTFQGTTAGPGGSGPGGGGGFGNSFGGGFGPGATPGARPPGGFGPTGQGAGTGGTPGAGSGLGAGKAGGKGAGGMGAGGAGHKGEGGEDGEHQRPAYLVEPDPDAMFGTDQMTAPPVIGG